MSRVHTFLVILLVLLIASAVHLMAVSLFPRMQEPLQHENGDTFNQDQVMQDIHDVLAVWVPLTMSGGVIVWGFLREYRRQRDTSFRRVGPP